MTDSVQGQPGVRPQEGVRATGTRELTGANTQNNLSTGGDVRKAMVNNVSTPRWGGAMQVGINSGTFSANRTNILGALATVAGGAILQATQTMSKTPSSSDAVKAASGLAALPFGEASDKFLKEMTKLQ